jgi:hypothetical protein
MPGPTRFSEKERAHLTLVRTIEELLDEKAAAAT